MPSNNSFRLRLTVNIILICNILIIVELRNFQQNPYEVLELRPNSTPQQIKQRFRKLSKQYHPDKNMKQNVEDIQKYNSIVRAYQLLKQNKFQLPDSYNYRFNTNSFDKGYKSSSNQYKQSSKKYQKQENQESYKRFDFGFNDENIYQQDKKQNNLLRFIHKFRIFLIRCTKQNIQIIIGSALISIGLFFLCCLSNSKTIEDQMQSTNNKIKLESSTTHSNEAAKVSKVKQQNLQNIIQKGSQRFRSHSLKQKGFKNYNFACEQAVNSQSQYLHTKPPLTMIQ